MHSLKDLADFPLLAIWGDTVRARRIQGERITLAVVELAADSVVPEHRHPNEQLGICLQGSGRFTIGDETRDIGPGSTWRILADVPHSLVTGPDGAVVIDVFNPVRDDWDDRPAIDGATPRWPAS